MDSLGYPVNIVLDWGSHPSRRGGRGLMQPLSDDSGHLFGYTLVVRSVIFVLGLIVWFLFVCFSVPVSLIAWKDLLSERRVWHCSITAVLLFCWPSVYSCYSYTVKPSSWHSWALELECRCLKATYLVFIFIFICSIYLQWSTQLMAHG